MSFVLSSATLKVTLFLFILHPSNGAEDNLQGLENLVQRRLEYLQNPANCSSARKVTLELPDTCGHGCQMHAVIYGLAFAYATERTLVLSPNSKLYHKRTWNDVFLPLSPTCTSLHSSSSAEYPTNDDPQLIYVPRIDLMNPKAEFIPLAYPADLGEKLKGLHSSPGVWWVAQLAKYVSKYQPKVHEMLGRELVRMGVRNGPIVGVHVRRTDKIFEAAFHNLTEYMVHVEDYFAGLDKKYGKTFKRRIFLATDEPAVLKEAQLAYPQYEIAQDMRGAETASVDKRLSGDGLDEVLIDIHTLYHTDYLVCTFSSNICRLAYAMRLALHDQTVNNFVSLDDQYHFAKGVEEHSQNMPTYPNVG